MKYFAGSFLWGAFAKLFDAVIKFLTIPLLLGYFGEVHYGLLTLALATNAYMQLFDMGMNTGGIKFFAQWIAAGKFELIDRVARTNITFYLIIGVLNSLVLIALALWGEGVFNVTSDEFVTFRNLLYVLSAFSIVNWLTFVLSQLLLADEKMIFTQQMLIIKSFLNLFIISVTIFFEWTILQYFFCTLLSNSIIIIPYYFFCRKRRLIHRVLPAFYWKDFSVVFKYGLAILAMSIFQFTAAQSRPLILGMFSADGIAILTEYRIIEVFPIFIISLGGMIISVLLPKTSKAVQNNNRAAIERLAYEGTTYTSIIVAILCFPVLINAREILTVYVGDTYLDLSPWLMLWIFTLTLYLHNSPVSSLVLATGKTKMLVYSSAVACVISVIVNVLLAGHYGVGSAVIGYMVYVIVQMGFYYFYFNGNVLGLSSLRVFKSFAVPTGLAFLTAPVMFLSLQINNAILKMALKTFLWLSMYVAILLVLRVVDLKMLRNRFFNIHY